MAMTVSVLTFLVEADTSFLYTPAGPTVLNWAEADMDNDRIMVIRDSFILGAKIIHNRRFKNRLMGL